MSCPTLRCYQGENDEEIREAEIRDEEDEEMIRLNDDDDEEEDIFSDD